MHVNNVRWLPSVVLHEVILPLMGCNKKLIDEASGTVFATEQELATFLSVTLPKPGPMQSRSFEVPKPRFHGTMADLTISILHAIFPAWPVSDIRRQYPWMPE